MIFTYQYIIIFTQVDIKINCISNYLSALSNYLFAFNKKKNQIDLTFPCISYLYHSIINLKN